MISMIDLNYYIDIALKSSQLLLIFITIFFNIFFLEVRKLINKDSGYNINQKTEYKTKLGTYKIIGIGLSILFFIISLLLLPLFLEIIVSSFPLKFSYNITKPVFVIITIIFIIFFIVSLKETINIHNRVNEIKEQIDKE